MVVITSSLNHSTPAPQQRPTGSLLCCRSHPTWYRGRVIPFFSVVKHSGAVTYGSTPGFTELHQQNKNVTKLEVLQVHVIHWMDCNE